MDNSSDSKAPSAWRELAIPLAPGPLSPLLRLAHVSGTPTHASHNAQVRTILDFELVLLLSGSGWIWSDDQGGSVAMWPGDVAFLPPHYRHGWGNEVGWHIAVHFDLHADVKLAARENLKTTPKVVKPRPLDFVPRFTLTVPAPAGATPERLTFPLITTVRNPGLWREKLEPLTLLYSRRVHGSLHAQLLFAEVMGWALRTLAEDAQHAAGAPEPEHPRILSLLRELETNPVARPSVSELASRAHMGLTAFREAFHRATGRSPRTYMEERRVERAARRLIESDRKIIEIAEAEGFDDPYHFSRVFKRVMGSSPRAYRRTSQG